MRKRTALLLAVSATVIFVLAFTWILPGRVAAASYDFFAGRQIRILVGFPPAGGHDLEARVVARHLPKYIPGNPSIIVQNMPGAGGVIQATYLYRRANPDGLIFGIVGRNAPLTAILEQVEYDLTKMPAIWGISGSTLDLVRGDLLKVKTAQDLFKVDPGSIVIAGRSRTGAECFAAQLALELVGISKGYKSVCAYPGTAPIKAAMERGEVTFFQGNVAHIMAGGAFREMYERGQAVPVWHSGSITSDGKIERYDSARQLPTFYEVYREVHGKSASGVKWEAYKASTIDIGMLQRTHLFPPGTPPDRVNILRQSMARLTKDPAFVADWERVFGEKLAPAVVPVELVERLKNDFLKPAPWQDFLRKFVKD